MGLRYPLDVILKFRNQESISLNSIRITFTVMNGKQVRDRNGIKKIYDFANVKMSVDTKISNKYVLILG